MQTSQRGAERALAFLAAALTSIAGCASTSAASWRGAASNAPEPASCPIVVTLPRADAAAFSHGGGDHVEEVPRLVAETVLQVARDRCPSGTTLALDDSRAIDLAREHRAASVLIPFIVEWRQARTDDPIGAFFPPHNRIIISLRLVPVAASGPERRVTITNRSRVTLNQRADRLLNDDFRRAVRNLLGE
jgi:hypothetical protein